MIELLIQCMLLDINIAELPFPEETKNETIDELLILYSSIFR
jgi:hypothetical protein